MRAAATIVLALSALVCVNAFAGSFYTAVRYTTADCSGTVVAASNVPAPIDECVAISATLSAKSSLSGSSISTTVYNTARDCTGATQTGNITSYTNGQCAVSFGGSTKYTIPAASAPIYAISIFSASGCAANTIISGPSYAFGLDAQCTGGVAITMVNGPLQACLTNCNSDCTNIPTGSCQDSPSGTGGLLYESNGVGAQAVVTYATAALIAVAAVVLSL